jgi:hypothetical protein
MLGLVMPSNSEWPLGHGTLSYDTGCSNAEYSNAERSMVVLSIIILSFIVPSVILLRS